MSNGKQPASRKSLKMGLCRFCAFVRGHEGETTHATRAGAEKETSQHNYINDNNIYINELGGCCVAAWGIA